MATRSKAFELLQALSIVAAALMPASNAFALSPELRITQLHHTAWSAKDGAPTGVEALAQTSDGYLWIAGAAGLFRFDGVRFERIDNIRGQRLPSSNVMTLFAPRAGGLWVGYRFGGASFIHDGKLTNYAEREGLPSGSVTRFAQDNSAVMWANTTRGLKRFDGSLWEDVRETFNLPSDYVKALRVARDGTLWVVIGRAVMFLRPGQATFVATDVQTSEEDAEFAQAPDGTLWLTDESLGAHAVYVPGESSWENGRHGWIALRDPARGPLFGKLVDRDGTLWTASPAGIHRVKDVAHLLDPQIAADSSRDIFSSLDGLTGPYASAFHEDREGNVWIGTSGGVDRFRESRLTRVDLPRGGSGFAIAPGDAGALLVGIDFEQGAFQVTGASTVDELPGPRYVNCLHRTDDGEVWFGGRAMLWHSGGSSGVSKWVPLAVPVDRANANYYPVQAIAKDRAGRLWVSVVRGGVFHFADGKWTRFDDPSLALAAGGDGRVWLGYPNSRVRVVDADNDAGREFSKSDGLDIGNVMSILPRATDTWVGGELGLARFDGQRFHFVTPRGGTQLPSVSGIVATPEGDLWLSTSAGAIQIPADEVQRLAADPTYTVRTELFDYLDGLPGTPNAIRPLPSIAAGTDGRLWFATTNGIAWIDPKHVRRNTLAPRVEVQSIVADGKRYEPGRNLRLPINPREVQITYTALSLSIPERVRFRYQLGADAPWQDAGPRRTAYFTDLRPGQYTFRVAAANNDGVWNETGASIDFAIPPAFYQTRWFYALCALAGVALLTVLYRVRVRQSRRAGPRSSRSASRRARADRARSARHAAAGDPGADLAIPGGDRSHPRR